MTAQDAVIELDVPHVESLLEEVQAVMGDRVAAPLHHLLHGYCMVLALLKRKDLSLYKLRRILFGEQTERTSTVLGTASDGGDGEARQGVPQQRPRRKGHGRRGAEEYSGCATVAVAHEWLEAGDSCPHCANGKLSILPHPSPVVRLTGQAPVGGTVYKLERLRCSLCGDVFTAQRPEGIGAEKYDAKAVAMIALLRYGQGMPGNRLAILQESLGIPLPHSTQWELLRDHARQIGPVFEHLIDEAAQGDVLYHDDTKARVLSLMDKLQRGEALREDDPDRTGIFTTGVVSTCVGHTIALYFTGTRHAGENLREVLKRRGQELDLAIQMCDPLSRNMPKDLATILANCLAHARRMFVDLVAVFPHEIRYVLEALKQVYLVDADAKKLALTPEERLRLHQEKSGPVMEALHQWLKDQLEQRKVEPNSSLGEAIGYMLKHWEALTLFLRQPGAPLDNNICERALKKSIRYRKNSLFYKTPNGAYVGDLYMSLIETCLLCHADPFDYLTQVLQNHAEAAADPGTWMPWNYKNRSASPPSTAPLSSASQSVAAPNVVCEAVASQPATTPSTVSQPAMSQPAMSQPAMSPNAVSDPVATLSAVNELVASQPAATSNPMNAPVAIQPVVSHAATTPGTVSQPAATLPPTMTDESAPASPPAVAPSDANPAGLARAGPAPQGENPF